MAPELPAGTVTVLFTDVEGSTSLTARRGDQAAHDLLNVQRELVRSQIAKHSGYEVKSMGDGFMVAFGSARLAIACAVAIQRAVYEHNLRQPADDRVAVRIGLNTGEVISEEADLFGETVNVAARVAAKARGGEIFISEAVRMVLARAPDITLVDRGRFRLKGLPERRRLYEVTWKGDVGTAAPALSERTPFVGREEELGELRRLLDRAAAGQGSLVTVAGEPGVGKTRLAEELLAVGRQRHMVGFIGHCVDMEGMLPYGPFVELLEAATRSFSREALIAALGESAPEVAQLLPELRKVLPGIALPPELPPGQARRYLFNGMRDFLARASQAQPLVLVLDDLQWADDATVLLLQHLAPQLDGNSILIVGTHRDLEAEGGRPFARGLEWLVRNRLVRQLALHRLPAAGVAGMLRGLSGQEPPAELVSLIYREAEGNPFFVEEVLRHLAQEEELFDASGRWRSDLPVTNLAVPDSVRLIISRRLERVSEDCRRMLATAAVIGRTFDFRLLETLSDLYSDRLLDVVDEAERAQLVVSGEVGPEARFAFTHELIRQSLLSDLSAARRQRLHLQIAEAMENASSAAQQEAAPDVAYHFLQAGTSADPQQTTRSFVLAGDRALSAAAFEDALRHYDAALSNRPPGDRGVRAELLHKHGLALLSLGRFDDALADWNEALNLYEAARDFPAVGRMCSAVSRQLLWSTQVAEALEVSLRGLRAIGSGTGRDRCLLLAIAGLSFSLGGAYEAADAMLAGALREAEDLDEQQVLGMVLGLKAIHHFCYGQLKQQIEAGERALAPLRAAGDLWDLADALWPIQIALVALGRLEEAAPVEKELETLAGRIGHAAAAMMAGRAHATRELMQNPNLDRFDSFTRADYELCRTGLNTALSVSYIGLAHFWRGRWREALECLEEGVRGGRPPGIYAGLDWSVFFLVNAYARPDGSAHGLLSATYAPAPEAMTTRRTISLTLQILRTARVAGLRPAMLWEMFRLSRRTKMKHFLPRPGRPNSLGSWVVLSSVVEGEATSGNLDRAAKLYPLVLDCIEQSGALMRFPEPRLLQTTAGIAAAAGRRWQRAEEHYQLAMRRAAELPHRLEQPEVRRFYARMLLDRGSPGDREKAQALLSEAISMYHEIGMPKHEEMAQSLLQEAS